MPEIIGNQKDVEWVGWGPLVAAKVLGSYKDTKSWFMMFRVEPSDPGIEYPAHTHPSLSYIYTLEGAFEYQGKVYGPGTYMIFPEGVEHGNVKVIGDNPLVFIELISGLSGMEEAIPQLKQLM